MSVMGIDPSLESCGFVVFNRGGMTHTQAVKSKLRGPARLNEIRDALDFLLMRDRPKLVCIEGYSFGSVDRAHAMGELGGTLRLRLWERQFSYIEVAPTRVKKFATGNGQAKKDHMLLAVYKRWGVEMQTNDEADAYVLARIALALTEGDDTLTEFQREVIKALQSKEMVK